MRGLSDSEVRASREKNGTNLMSPRKRKSFGRHFLENLGDPVIKILIGALIVNLLFMFRNADWFETGGIAVSVVLATLISTMSEYGSQAAFERLSEECSKIKSRVIRNGTVCEIDIADVVVGDLLLVGAGEQISADGELISGILKTDQSAMTGESREVSKRAKMYSDAFDNTPASPYYCLRGCTVISGSGVIRVASVGDSTFLGGISREIQTDTRESPLKVRLSRLARQISTLGYVLALLVAAAYLFNIFVIDSAYDLDIIKYKLTNLSFLFSHLLHALTLGLTVIVVAVPEGLPMMIAVVLSSNIKKMVRDNVLVRKPVGIEAAGSMNILFTDKTGTLTEGRLSVGKLFLGDLSSVSNASALADHPTLYRHYLTSAVVNSSSIIGGRGDGRQAMGGNSTDRAILDSAIKRIKEMPNINIIERLEFDSARKFSAALIRRDRERCLYVKGAPEKLLPYVTGYIDTSGNKKALDKTGFYSLCRRLTEQGKRILLLTVADEARWGGYIDAGEFTGLTIICLITLEDKIRKEASESVRKLRGAGIHVVMITGDNAQTARYIAEKCGIIGEGCDAVLTSAQLSSLTDGQIKELLPRLAVVARALPSDKSRLVRISQELDLVVGMTGDGINDAPALKRADVGFSMGSGTQVAKDAGDVIIIDNNLASIVKAVLYGRNIFKSIRKFISLQLTMNLCAVGVSIIGPFIGIDSPVTVVQMLWINIIMDTLGGLAFAGEAPLQSCMAEKPKRRDEPILNGYMIFEILWQGVFTVALCIAFLSVPEITSRFRWSSDNIYLLTAFFALFIFASVFNCFNARTDRLRLLSNITLNKTFIAIMAAVLVIQIVFVYLGGSVLRTAPLTLSELAFTAALALCVFPTDFVRKLIWRIFGGKIGY